MKNFKRVILTTAMSLLFFVGLTSMVSMDPPYNATDCAADCEFLVGAGVFATNGECRSACSTCTNPSSSVATVAVCLCNLIDAQIPGGLTTPFGTCVNDLKNIFSGS